MVTVREIFVYFLLPVINFFVFFKLGQTSLYDELIANARRGTTNAIKCKPRLPKGLGTSFAPASAGSAVGFRSSSSSSSVALLDDPPTFEAVDSKKFSAYSEEHLVEMFFPTDTDTLLLNHNPSSPCTSYINPMVSINQECSAVVFANNEASSNTLRFNALSKEGPIVVQDKFLPNGFFSKTGNPRGRKRLREKIGELFENLEEMEADVGGRLQEHGLVKGDDITVMVVNDGEIDLFMNFACSCKAHNISLRKMIVFAGSKSIVNLIDITGAIGFYHENFASVSVRASEQYLDSVFVDMMWFKAFSVWLMLRAGLNVIFQDVDLVWFREPYSYFREYGDFAAKVHHNGERPDAYFSDDGQRGSIRYSPFYANSGFYYLISNPKTIYFAYSVMSMFDIMQSTGSHQNIFTLRLSEGLDIASISPKLLSLRHFPTGVVYHHDKGYMQKIVEGTSEAFNFHMCWTANKKEKLDFFLLTKLWYMLPSVSLPDLIPGGRLNRLALSMLRDEKKWTADVWGSFSSHVCHVMPGAP